MPGEIFDEFNTALPEMADAFGESWSFNSQDYDAIAIDKLDIGTKIMLGGQLVDATTEIFVSEDVFNDSAVKIGSRVTARGQPLRVIKIGSDGDASRSLVCGPDQLDIWSQVRP